MEEIVASQYWCHSCMQRVHRIMETEIKCPFCQTGFVEEMTSGTSDAQNLDLDNTYRAVSLWAPLLFGMIGNRHRRRRRRSRSRRAEVEEEQEQEEDEEENDYGDIDSDFEREFESFVRRRRRTSASMLNLFQRVQAIASEIDRSQADRAENGETDRDRDRVIVIDPSNRTIVVRDASDPIITENQNDAPIGSFGDYFVGTGFDVLLQRLAENDPNRYGSLPAQREAIEALPTVIVKDSLQCSICLDEFEMGSEAKEMPCQHKFHSNCIVQWLELHCTCPVCRFQMPSRESERYGSIARREIDHMDIDNDDTNTGGLRIDDSEMEIGETERNLRFPWMFNSFFPRSESQRDET